MSYRAGGAGAYRRKLGPSLTTAHLHNANIFIQVGAERKVGAVN